jgi:sulfoquinovosidase
MERRDFLMTGATMAVAGSLPRLAEAAAGEDHAVGDFILRRTGNALQVFHRREPDRVIWESAADGNYIVAETAIAKIQDFGTPQGSFEITDTVSASYGNPQIDAIHPGNKTLTVRGRLGGKNGNAGFNLAFEAMSSTHLRFTLNTDNATVNRVRLVGASVSEEGIFGFAGQLTYFNQKGRLLPILVQEHGVGRGQVVVTQAMDLFESHGGGSPYTTECPAPHYLTSRLRSLFLENSEYSTFDMRNVAEIGIKVWAASMTGRILYGESPLDLIETYTEYAGRMRALPDWIHSGLVIGAMGGTDVVLAKLKDARDAGIPIAGLWLQDWVGVRVTKAGQQLWWNWTLDETLYPRWKELVANLENQGARMLIYINPFLSHEEGHNALFVEGAAKGYLVKNPDGTPFLNRNTNFTAGLLDLSNPDTRTWMKNVIKTEMIGKAGASGWMHDFGEALPFNGKLAGGADPNVWHNHFPVAWAQLAREAIEEAGRGDDIVFFNRSGFTRTPAVSTLIWLGDQIENWSEYDGLKSAVVGTLSAGMSGYSLVHSDTGGYVSFQFAVGGREIPLIARTPELLMRWTELNAFTAVLRGHEGLAPDVTAQFNSSAETLAHTARFAKVFKGLAAYRKKLVAEAAAKGYPVCRALFLHYPDDRNTYQLRYQYLLGSELMIAPVLDKGADKVDAYFPAGEAQWIDLWTGADVGAAGEWSTVPAPIGKPAVFLKKGSPSGEEILGGLKAVGVL